MNSRITLNINEEVLAIAREHAKILGISVDELVEILLCEAVSAFPQNVGAQPISSWVYKLSKGTGQYITDRSHNDLKNDCYNNR